ncbi:MAG: hypothetical protein LRY71_03120 [Bacillaceae bacterium]|nr:hypothetical protein [Bacillaceae bacterium]
MKFKIQDEWKRWLHSEKELLYQIGALYLANEEEIEALLVKTMKTFRREELFLQSFKKAIYSTIYY